MKNRFILYLLSFIILSCQPTEKKQEIEFNSIKESKIRPPLLKETLLAETFKINNSEDTVLISKRGGYVSIPKNCFINSDGVEVVEDITISFNEYLNTADILLSGIPMTYVENGRTMNFQSAGMCEVLAYIKDEQLNLKNDKSIGIGLRSLAQDNDYNLYYFDTLIGEWLEKEKNIPISLANQLPIAPINLQKTDTDDILTIEIDDYKIRPLYRMWHRSKFCIYGESELVRSDSSIWWYDMTINPTLNRDLYDLTFNGVGEDRKQWTYNLTVQPVIDSANYEVEFARFQKNMKTYIKKIESFKKELEQNSLNSVKIKAEIELNIIEDSLLSEKKWQEDSLLMVNYIYEDSLRQVQQVIEDSLIGVQTKLWEGQQAERYKSNRTRIEVMRSFNISQMGIFNCDRFYTRPILITKSVSMLINNQARRFDSAYLVDVKSNAVLNYLEFSVDSYLIDLDLSAYIFIGILGGEVYMVNVSLEKMTERQNLVTMKHISMSELKGILN
jgi:hypothetical protein